MIDALLGFLQLLLGWDTTVFLTINSHHSAFWDNFMWIYSDKFTWVVMYASFGYVMFRNFPLRATIFCLLAVVLLITLCDQIASTLTRNCGAGMGCFVEAVLAVRSPGIP